MAGGKAGSQGDQGVPHPSPFDGVTEEPHDVVPFCSRGFEALGPVEEDALREEEGLRLLTTAGGSVKASCSADHGFEKCWRRLYEYFYFCPCESVSNGKPRGITQRKDEVRRKRTCITLGFLPPSTPKWKRVSNSGVTPSWTVSPCPGAAGLSLSFLHRGSRAWRTKEHCTDYLREVVSILYVFITDVCRRVCNLYTCVCVYN